MNATNGQWRRFFRRARELRPPTEEHEAPREFVTRVASRWAAAGRAAPFPSPWLRLPRFAAGAAASLCLALAAWHAASPPRPPELSVMEALAGLEGPPSGLFAP